MAEAGGNATVPKHGQAVSEWLPSAAPGASPGADAGNQAGTRDAGTCQVTDAASGEDNKGALPLALRGDNEPRGR